MGSGCFDAWVFHDNGATVNLSGGRRDWIVGNYDVRDGGASARLVAAVAEVVGWVRWVM